MEPNSKHRSYSGSGVRDVCFDLKSKPNELLDALRFFERKVPKPYTLNTKPKPQTLSRVAQMSCWMPCPPILWAQGT